MTKIPLSVTIISYNEASRIHRPLKALEFVSEVIVVDSFSTDGTAEIAQKLGAKVYQEKFQGYGQQKNLAASFCQNSWILNLDADEEISPGLYKFLDTFFKGDQRKQTAILKLPRLTYFCNRPIYHGGWFPDFKARLYHRDKAHWTTPEVHENVVLKGELREENTSTLKATRNAQILHYSFPDVHSQIHTNLKFATLGARELRKRPRGRPGLMALLFRPFMKFVECYIVKRGFLDGYFGFVIAINAAHSMFLKYALAKIDIPEVEANDPK